MKVYIVRENKCHNAQDKLFLFCSTVAKLIIHKKVSEIILKDNLK